VGQIVEARVEPLQQHRIRQLQNDIVAIQVLGGLASVKIHPLWVEFFSGVGCLYFMDMRQPEFFVHGHNHFCQMQAG